MLGFGLRVSTIAFRSADLGVMGLFAIIEVVVLVFGVDEHAGLPITGL